MGSDEVHRVLHRLHPAIGVGLAVTLEVQRYDFLLEEVVDGRRIELVLQRLVSEGALVGECPTSTLAVAFVPPSIKDGEIEDAVHLGLFARSARGFEGARRRVHPDIYAGDELAGQTHVVVLQEDNLAKELRATADLEDVLDESLSTTIGRVCLTGEEELYRILGVVDDALQTLQVGEEQVCTLVRGKATPEADEQSIGVNPFEDGDGRLGVAAIAQPLLAVEGADVVDEAELDGLVRFPDRLVGELLDLRPRLFLRLELEEDLAEVLRVEL